MLKEMGTNNHNFILHLLRLTAAVLSLSTTASAIGVNYGTLGNNLPPPATVANFLKTQTIIDSVKLFDANPDVLRAFAGSGLSVTVTIPNGLIPSLADVGAARGWINDNIAPFHPQTKINRVLVGNEIMATLDDNLISNLVPAMKAVHQALVQAGINDIQVTTAHSMGILKASDPPSAGQFWPGHDVTVYAPMLEFLRQTKAPFTVNPYSYFGYSPQMANYALFRPNPGVHDPVTGITYTNMFDATLDATYTAMRKLGFPDVGLLVGETGWPTLCLPGQLECNVENAAWYNSELVRRSVDGVGTPLVPNKRIGIFLFALFNENEKPGPITEQNWGLFRPDMTPVYHCGVLRSEQPLAPIGRQGGRKTHKGSAGGATPAIPVPAAGGGKKWCVAKAGAAAPTLQANIDYACGNGADCKPIQPGGPCFEPNNVVAHATFAMNSYYRAKGSLDSTCYFSNTGVVTAVDPSNANCKFP
ncbi:unnamed protein product [Linum tenue]|uniref:glucan endo-1,3-beta-D-glucosidase n=2 Tax=Linum tenue TaxID=586396 RepID=A0AAV0MB71_9ROSI|nr:unnamed protein product [Linum tenue]